MAQKTDAQLQTQRNQIESETANKANSAARVGQMIEDVIDSKINNDKIIDEDDMASNSASAVPSQQSTKAYVDNSITSREFNRTFSAELLFDKNEIFHAPFIVDGDLNLTIGVGGLVNQSSSMRATLTFDGTNSINFGAGFDFKYPANLNGFIPDAGTYRIYFLYTNGSVDVNMPGVSSETSGLVPLSTPANFAVVADGENALDLSWDDVSDEVQYQIEKSLTGTGGWVLFSNPAAGSASDTETGLNPGDTIFYRIKAIGDGVTRSDSAYTSANGTTESSGDVTAPTFTFLPANGNSTWTVNRPLTITANEAMRNDDGTEITNANVATRITLKETNSGGTNIAFTATIDATKTIITITPTTIYGVNQLVYLAIDNVEDVNGNEITLQSITFTTTAFTYYNGTTNRLQYGDILDSIFAANDTNFWLELTIINQVISGNRTLIAKSDQSGNQRSFTWFYVNSDIFFAWYRFGTAAEIRVIKWAGAMTSGEHELVLKYDGSIDTNDGLDRLTLEVDGSPAGSKTVDTTSGGFWPFAVNNSTAQLASGIQVNNAGTPVGTAWYSGEAKDMIVRSTSGSVVELNVPVIKSGTDTSGNARHGTWV